jgi:3-keto-disaccharide hydrolase
MKTAAVLLLAVAGSARWNFEDATVGRLPKGWSAAKTGRGPGSVWKVVDDQTANKSKALAQTSSEGPNPLFNLCIADESRFRNLDMSVSLKAVTGKLDQGGGLVWRLRDANNYYIARWNPLEDNFRVYKVVGGTRTQLATADVKSHKDMWHKLRIIHSGDAIQCYLDGEEYLKVTDGTFKEAGKVGLWTKSDAVTYFDDLTVDDLDSKQPKTDREQECR